MREMPEITDLRGVTYVLRNSSPNFQPVISKKIKQSNTVLIHNLHSNQCQIFHHTRSRTLSLDQKILDLSKTTYPTALYRYIFSLSNQLKTVQLYGCNNVDSDAIKAIAKNCKGLMYLRLSGCNNVDSDAIKAIAKNCPRLTQLALNGCKNVDSVALKAIAQNCKGLTYLDLKGCSKLKESDISNLQRLLPECKIRWKPEQSRPKRKREDDSEESEGLPPAKRLKNSD